MSAPSETRHLSVSIRQDARKAYDLLSRPGSFPRWASGLAGSGAIWWRRRSCWRNC